MRNHRELVKIIRKSKENEENQKTHKIPKKIERKTGQSSETNKNHKTIIRTFLENHKKLFKNKRKS